MMKPDPGFRIHQNFMPIADKLKMDLLKEFEYNNNNYLELVCPTETGN